MEKEQEDLCSRWKLSTLEAPYFGTPIYMPFRLSLFAFSSRLCVLKKFGWPLCSCPLLPNCLPVLSRHTRQQATLLVLQEIYTRQKRNYLKSLGLKEWILKVSQVFPAFAKAVALPSLSAAFSKSFPYISLFNAVRASVRFAVGYVNGK